MRVDTGGSASTTPAAALPPDDEVPQAAPPPHDDAHAADGTAASTTPSTTLQQMALNPPALLLAPPPASIADQVAGTQPRPAIDRTLALMANDVYGPAASGTPAPGSYGADLAAAGWTRVTDSTELGQLGVTQAFLDGGASDFGAAIYRNGDNYVVAFAGTNPKEFGDDKADLGQGLGIPTAQYARAQVLAQHMADAVGTEHVAFTGHSLGGGLAATAALTVDGTAVTFNAAGVSNETIRATGRGNPNDVRADWSTNGQVRSYSVPGDPLTTLDVSGAPAQIGSLWSLPPAPGVSPLDLLKLHGGSGPDQLYVDQFDAGAGAIRPGAVPNPVVQQVIDGIPGFGDLPLAERGAVLNTLGNLGTAVKSLGEAQLENTAQAATDAVRVLAGDQPHPETRLAGVGANLLLDNQGAVAEAAAGFAGRSVTNTTDTVGAHLRELGAAKGHPAAGAAVAGVVEGAGNMLRSGIERAGAFVNTAADRAGDAARWAADRVADAQGLVDRGAQWLARKTGEGAVTAAQVTASAVTAVARGTATVLDRAADSASGAWDRVSSTVGSPVTMTVTSAPAAAREAGSSALNWAQDRARSLFRFGS